MPRIRRRVAFLLPFQQNHVLAKRKWLSFLGHFGDFANGCIATEDKVSRLGTSISFC